MAFDGTGKIYIPTEDFWVFVHETLELGESLLPIRPRIIDSCESLRFDIVHENAQEKVIAIQDIDMALFWAYVEKWHPFAKTAAEYCFSRPDFTSPYDVEIEYAVSTVCHPSEWAKPPSFLQVGHPQEENNQD